jgi:hypothetical protein
MPIVAGKLIGIDPTQPDGTIEFLLSGYGSRFPQGRGQGSDVGSICSVQTAEVAAGAGGEFTIQLVGNDVIDPPGTYYAVTVKDSNGDAVQCNAYMFLESHGDYDLDFEDPFDPTLPMPPVPPLIFNQLLIVDYDPAPNFPGDQFTAWQITLAGDAVATTGPIVGGNLYTFIIKQDQFGGHAFTWPDTVFNAAPVNQEPNAWTIQTFVAEEGGDLYPIAGGTYYP